MLYAVYRIKAFAWNMRCRAVEHVIKCRLILIPYQEYSTPPFIYIHTGLHTQDETVKTTKKYADPKVKSSLLLRIKSFLYLILRFSKKRNKFTVAGNHNYEVTESKNSVQSSLKSQPSWVTLYKITSLLPLFTRPWS